MVGEPALSVVILCYRSEGSIIGFVHDTLEVVRKLTSDYEVILVANYVEGTDDKTIDYAKQLEQEDNRIFTLAKPKKGMMGWDMRQGLDAATGKHICVIDGDGQFPITSIAECYAEIIKGNHDLVKTYRTKRNDGFYRSMISAVYNALFSILFPGLGSKDANSKPKIISKEAYQKMTLKSDDWFVDAEIMLNIRDLEMSFLEIPVEFKKLEGRTSFVKFQAVFEFLRNLIHYRLKK